jgi:AraC-like DNA-binding protein
LVRWFWITRWQLAGGQTSRQHLIAYPAFNLVIEPGSIGLYGPTTRASFRDLNGFGWAIGALLWPAAVRSFTPDPSALMDGSLLLSEAALHQHVAAAMARDRPSEAVAQFSSWLVERVGPLGRDALLANQLVAVAEESDALRVGDLAGKLAVSARTVERLARTHIGVTPAALIRRRRIQEAAERLRLQPELDLAQLAVEIGYADQAHLSHDFARILGLTPGNYRRAQAGPGKADPASDA